MQQATPQPSLKQQDQTMFSSLGPFEAFEGASQGQGPSSQTHNAPPQAESPKQTFFYTQDDDLDLSGIDEQEGQSSPLVMPFQPSTGMPTVIQPGAKHMRTDLRTSPPSPSTPKARQRRLFSPLTRLLIAGLVVITVLVGGVLVLAQSAAPPVPGQNNNTQTSSMTGRPTRSTQQSRTTALPRTHATPSPSAHSSAQSTTPVPSQQTFSQLGWAQAGLSQADAVEAERTASTFVDREMSFDYRNIGSLTNHSGTLTAATFLLTPGGQIRFVHNDVRMINNRLYDTIQNTQLIQQVMDIQPMLVKFQVQQIQGQAHQFAWVRVSFELFQSKIDPATGKRAEEIELDPATGQPRVHQMVVVLLRVPPQSQGANAPMGGTGWLVNVYALDATTLPPVATDPSL